VANVEMDQLTSFAALWCYTLIMTVFNEVAMLHHN